MRKIQTLFVRDEETNRRYVRDEVSLGCEWVTAGEGIATRKYDGTCCLIRDGQLFKRREIKATEPGAPFAGVVAMPDSLAAPVLSAEAERVLADTIAVAEGASRLMPAFVTVPDGFEAVAYDEQTQKLYGWLPVDPDSKEDRFHREAFAGLTDPPDGTYELCGPRINKNPEGYGQHFLIPHAHAETFPEDPPRDFAGLAAFLPSCPWEGIVWHHPDGRMVKIKRRDFPRATA